MAKFNKVQKKKRAQTAERKRALQGDPSTRKLKTKPQPVSLSGKRKRKLLKKWRRDQKEAMEKGLLTMQDVEMAGADGGESQNAHKASTKFPMKKALKLTQLKGKGKKKKKKGKSSKPAAEAPTPTPPPADAMVE